MATRPAHVQDSAVAERRLRPIYEWLDSGNPKKALQETEKVLRKTPNLQCAKALKALSLLQLGRDAECVTILNNLSQEIPTDNATLQAMTICYRDLGQLEKVCQLYEKAVQNDSQNEELHTHLFMSYVRTSNFKLQQQSAMLLFKMKNKNPYYFWAVMSIVLQATKGPHSSDVNKKAVLLSLAERMIEKLIQENKLEAEQEIQLYLMILERQEKFDMALKVLDGPLGTKLMTGSTDQSRIYYLTKLERWAELATLCTELLQNKMDRWDVWQHYLSAVFSQTSPHSNNISNHVDNSTECIDDLAEKAHEFISSLIENVTDDNLFKSSSNYELRGPYLARFELYKHLVDFGKDATAILGDVFELFVEYFRIFGHKNCVVSDLKIYLHLLSKEDRLRLAQRLLQDVGISGTSLPSNEKQMQRHIGALQLSRLCGNHENLNAEFLKSLVECLVLHYENGQKKFGAQLPTDPNASDAYALLACHILFDLAHMSNSSGPLLTALSLLERVLSSSPSNFHAKLLCIRLYHILGCPEMAQKWYESLDAKHLQMDSLGFVHCGQLLQSGALNTAQFVFDSTLKFFSTNYRDSIDHLTFSYKFGSFLKLEEFMDFRERLNNSLHYTITAIDRMILEFIFCTNLKNLNTIDGCAKNNNINYEKLRDNNDYEVYISWDPDRIVQKNIKKPQEILFQQEKDLTKLRAGILNIVSTALDFLKQPIERETISKTLQSLHADWLASLEGMERTEYPPIRARLAHPLPSRLAKQLRLPWRQVVGGVVALLVGDKGGESGQAFSQSVSGVVTRLEEEVDRLKGEEDQLWEKRGVVETAVNALEVLSVASVLCGVCHEVLLVCNGSQVPRRGRKKPGEAGGQLAGSVRAVRDACAAYDACLARWPAPALLPERLGALRLAPSAALPHALRDSHAATLQDLRSAAAAKIKFLNTLC